MEGDRLGDGHKKASCNYHLNHIVIRTNDVISTMFKSIRAAQILFISIRGLPKFQKYSLYF